MSLDDPADPTLDTMDPANKQELLARYWNNGFRDFHYDRSDYNATAPEENYSIGRTFSLWTRLTGGQKYYMENQWENDGGLEHWTVGVEIQPDVAVSADHPHLVPGKEEVIVHQDLLRDIS